MFFRKHITAINNRDEKTDKRQFLRNLLFRLVIPSVVFSIIEFIPSNVLQQRDLTILSFIDKTIWGRTYWFVSALVVAELFLFISMQTKSKNMLFYLVISMAAFYTGQFLAEKKFYLLGPFSSYPWEAEKGLMATVFLVLGGIYWKYENKIDIWLMKPYVAGFLLLIYLLAISLFHNHIKVLISMDSINMYGIAISSIGIVLLATLSKLLRVTNAVTKQLDVIGRNTIGFYFVCGAIPKVLMLLLPRILPSANLPYMIFGFVLSFALAYVVVVIMNKYFRFLFDLRNGFKHK